jgi:hypothetical protein
MGSEARWRTMPWMVTVFAILVIPLGLTHIVLVISQPVIVGSWCTLCLLSAAIMLPMIPLEFDEVIAMGQFLRKSTKKGDSFWHLFWKGGALDSKNSGTSDSFTLKEFAQTPSLILSRAFTGISFSLTLVLSSVLGLMFMFAPSVFGYTGITANVQHIAGALTLAVAVIAMGEIVRTVRFTNVLLGVVIIFSPFLDTSISLPALMISITGGLAISILSIPRGQIKELYGSWYKLIK